MNTLLITNPFDKSRKYICKQLQNAWDAERKKNNKKKKKDFLEESEYFKIIDKQQKYEKFDFSFIPQVIFIVPELMWANDDVNEGYDIARELVIKKYRSEFIQVVFLSVLDRGTLSKIVDARNKNFVEAFPHYCLLDHKINLQFVYYSEIHFNLVKSLRIFASGKLDLFIHQFSAEFDEDKLKSLLKEFVNDLEIFNTPITDEDKQALKTMLIDKKNSKKLIELKNEVKTIYERIKLYQDNPNSRPTHSKSKYQVLIIEDDERFRKVFVDSFSEVFNVVCSNDEKKTFTLELAIDFIKRNANEFNIFILDLLYQKDEKWLNFSGLDLYNILKKENPYSTIRIITSLPRDILSKLIASNFKEPVPFSHIFTKTKGIENLKSIIIDRSDEIIEECKKNEKKKSMWKPFPQIGIFNGEMIPSYLFSLFYESPDVFQHLVNKAMDFYNHFLKEHSLKENNNWDGELISPKQKDIIKLEKFLEKLPIILTYRLLAIQFYSKSDKKILIPYNDWRDILNIVSDLVPYDFTKDINTKLGLHVVKKGSKKLTTHDTYQIEVKNLFPHEIDFIRNIKYNYDDIICDNYLNENQSQLFKLLIINGGMILYEDWFDLNLDFNPYNGYEIEIESSTIVKTIDNGVLNYRNFIAFLKSLFINFNRDPEGLKLIILDIINSEIQDVFESDELICDIYDDLMDVMDSN